MVGDFDTAAARARCEAATPGPWETWTGTAPSGKATGGVCQQGNTTEAIFEDGYIPADDAEFIAAARTDLPAALDRIDELERENMRLDAARCTHPTDLGVVYHSERDLLKRIAELERQRDKALALHHQEASECCGFVYDTCVCGDLHPCPTVQALTDTEASDD